MIYKYNPKNPFLTTSDKWGAIGLLVLALIITWLIIK